MAKLPYIAIYPGDWERDANCITPLAEFALLKLTFKLNDAKIKGIYTANLCSLSVLFKSDFDKTKALIKELKDNDILEILALEDDFFEIKSRRILHEVAISGIRSETGKTGGRGHKKQNKSKTKAKQKQNAEYEYENDNVIEDDKKYERDEILEKEILVFFGFNEIKNPDKQSLIFQFCQSLTNSANIENFKTQFKNYCEFKKLSGFKHNFNNFLGQQGELFLDGAWNAENWEEKLKDEKSKAPEKEKTTFPDKWDPNYFYNLPVNQQKLFITHITKLGYREKYNPGGISYYLPGKAS